MGWLDGDVRWCALLLAGVLACSGDDGGGGESIGEAGSEGSTAAEGSTSGGSTSATTSSGSGDGSGGSTVDASESGSGSADTGAIGCGEAGCGDAMVCVHPCCGGAGPVCTPLPEGRTCPAGSMQVDPSMCTLGCDAAQCCMPTGGCEAPDPYCVEMARLVCGGEDPVADQCSVDDCFGTLDGNDLACVCG